MGAHPLRGGCAVAERSGGRQPPETVANVCEQQPRTHHPLYLGAWGAGAGVASGSGANANRLRSGCAVAGGRGAAAPRNGGQCLRTATEHTSLFALGRLGGGAQGWRVARARTLTLCVAVARWPGVRGAVAPRRDGGQCLRAATEHASLHVRGRLWGGAQDWRVLHLAHAHRRENFEGPRARTCT